LALLRKKAIAFRSGILAMNVGMRPCATPSDLRQKSDPTGRSNQNFFFDAVAFGGETISQLLHHQGTGSPGGKN